MRERLCTERFVRPRKPASTWIFCMMADVSDESSCIHEDHEDFENFVSPTVLQTNLTLETPKAFIEVLDESYEEFQNCVEDIVLEIIKKLHKNKKT